MDFCKCYYNGEQWSMPLSEGEYMTEIYVMAYGEIRSRNLTTPSKHLKAK